MLNPNVKYFITKNKELNPKAREDVLGFIGSLYFKDNYYPALPEELITHLNTTWSFIVPTLLRSVFGTGTIMRVHGALEFYWLDEGVLYNASGSPDNVPSMSELIEVDALFTLPDSFLNKLSGDDLNELCDSVSDVPVWCEATGYLTWGSLSLPMCKSEASDLIECIKCNRSTQCEDPVPTTEIQSFYESDFALVYSRFGLHIKAAFDKYDCNKLYLLVYIEGMSTLQNHTIHTDASNFELVDGLGIILD